MPNHGRDPGQWERVAGRRRAGQERQASVDENDTSSLGNPHETTGALERVARHCMLRLEDMREGRQPMRPLFSTRVAVSTLLEAGLLEPLKTVPSAPKSWSGPLPDPVQSLGWGPWHEDADIDDNFACWDTTRNWHLEVERIEPTKWKWTAAYVPDDTAVEQTGFSSTKDSAIVAAKDWAINCASNPRLLLPDHSTATRLAELIDSIFPMDSHDEADRVRRQILAIEERHPGSLWSVARGHPHVEVRAAATFLATTLLMGDRPLVRKGVLDAVAHAAEDD